MDPDRDISSADNSEDSMEKTLLPTRRTLAEWSKSRSQQAGQPELPLDWSVEEVREPDVESTRFSPMMESQLIQSDESVEEVEEGLKMGEELTHTTDPLPQVSCVSSSSPSLGAALMSAQLGLAKAVLEAKLTRVNSQLEETKKMGSKETAVVQSELVAVRA